MARSTRLGDPDQDYIYFMGSETLPSACYILSDESSVPFYSTSNRHKNTEFIMCISLQKLATHWRRSFPTDEVYIFIYIFYTYF